eukprot:6485604-Alexandrium_andersonii.AAC.1
MGPGGGASTVPEQHGRGPRAGRRATHGSRPGRARGTESPGSRPAGTEAPKQTHGQCLRRHAGRLAA